MGLTVVTPPAGIVMTLDDAKAHLRVPASITLYDDDIQAKINAVIEYVQLRIDTAILTQTWEWTLDEFPPVMKPPGGRVASIQSLTYIDQTGVTQTLDPDQYQADLASIPARLMPLYGQIWPKVQGGMNQVKLTYVVGSDTVPAPLIQAIKLFLGDAWVNRESSISLKTYIANEAAENLLWPYRRPLP